MSSMNNGDLGDQIFKTVAASTNWINDVIDDIRAGAFTPSEGAKYTVDPEILKERAKIQAERQARLQEQTRQREQIRARIRPVSTSGNILRSFVAFFTGSWSLFGVLGIFVELDDNPSLFGIMFGAIIAGIFGSITISLIKKNKKVKRWAKYVEAIGSRTHIDIADMENSLGYSHKTVVKDFRDMIAAGVFKQAHIDEEERYLMLTNEVYEQYLNAERGYEQRVQAEKEKLERDAANGVNPELEKTLETGRQYIREIKAANDAIPGEDITAKLNRLEEVAGAIFKIVEEHPEKLSELRKFMDYYMPTTLKLVNSYHEFDMQPVQGENIRGAKREIEDTLDMINLAFENLSDRLYEDVKMDVSADISVLKTLLAQEGLKDSDFDLK